ncbi:hypothetical protein G6L37_04810 [Agrobacterium rubi]|nr:hypothetical protein [Agrobacterium rubi]NTF24675.1 hypothetical protein [Agrobacterium rubi]
MVGTTEVHEFDFKRVAEAISSVEEIHFLADYDAIPYGEEKFRTVHFGWTGPGKTGEMITVATNSEADGWEISVRGDEQTATLEFRNGTLFEYVDDEPCAVAQESGGDTIPTSLVDLIQASRAAGLSSFDYTPDMEAGITHS